MAHASDRRGFVQSPLNYFRGRWRADNLACFPFLEETSRKFLGAIARVIWVVFARHRFGRFVSPERWINSFYVLWCHRLVIRFQEAVGE